MKALLPTLALLAALPAGAAEPVVVKSVESAAGPKPLSWKHTVAFEGEAGDDKLAVVLEVQVPPAADVRPANDKTAVERLSPTLYSVSGKLEKTGDAFVAAVGTGGTPFMTYLQKHLDETNQAIVV